MLVLFQRLQHAVSSDVDADIDDFAMASISSVEMNRDLTIAKVYVSFFDDDDGDALESLERLQPYVRKQIASRMRLRFAPEIHFYDESDHLEPAEVCTGMMMSKFHKLQLVCLLHAPIASSCAVSCRSCIANLQQLANNLLPSVQQSHCIKGDCCTTQLQRACRHKITA